MHNTYNYLYALTKKQAAVVFQSVFTFLSCKQRIKVTDLSMTAFGNCEGLQLADYGRSANRKFITFQWLLSFRIRRGNLCELL